MKALLPILALTVVVASGCSFSAGTPPPLDTKAASDTPMKAAAPAGAVVTGATLGTEKGGEAKTSFPKATEEVFVNATVDLKGPAKVKADWYVDATDKNTATTKLIEKELELAPPQNIATFNVKKTGGNWDPGDYHVDILVDDKVVQTLKFKFE